MKERLGQPRPVRHTEAPSPRDRYLADIGATVVRFQDGTTVFDDLAAQILALDRSDLPCMTMLLFGGSASIDALMAALQQSRSAVIATADRLQLAGYARRRPDIDQVCIELTEHARQWIMRIWEPLREEGHALLSTYSTRDLSVMAAFLVRVCEIQERHHRRLRKWLAVSRSTARQSHLRGGLAPAALRRVQLFVEANLARTIHLGDLAVRAGLSRYHFARAFKTSAGITPRAFIEQRRLERAKHLMTHSEHSLADIAAESGFGTQSRLTATFKRRTGFTPAAYRRGRPTPPT